MLHLQVSFDEGGTTSYGPARAVVVLDDAWVPGRVYVDAAAAPGGDGASWASAFDDLHEGLAASAGLVDLPTEVWVREGVYTPAPANGDRAVHFRVESGTHVYGGFAGGETELDQRDPRAHPVVLSGDLNGDDGQPGGSMGENTQTVLIAGAARPSSSSTVYAFPLVQERRQNIRVDGLSIRSGNSGSHGGNASVCLSGDVALIDSEIAGHTGRTTVTCFGGVAAMIHCRFVGNSSSGFASLVDCRNAGTTSGVHEFTGCEFVDNRFRSKLVDLGSTAHFTNCTFYRNRSFSEVGFMLGVNRASATFSNCIFWENDFPQDIYVNIGSAQVAYSVYTGPYSAGGNVAGPPRFVHPAGPDGELGTPDDDLRLGPHSPCIDAGDNAALADDRFDLDGDGDTEEPSPLDLAGAPRQVDDPLTPDTGAGSPPIVDMGAREHQ